MPVLPEWRNYGLYKNAHMTLDELLYCANMEEREETVIETMVQAIQDLLEDYGDIPEHVI